MKPAKPFMIMVGDDYVKINVHATPGQEDYTLVDWEGSRYTTRLAAERAVKVFGIEHAEVVEIEDEVRTIIPASK